MLWNVLMIFSSSDAFRWLSGVVNYLTLFATSSARWWSIVSKFSFVVVSVLRICITSWCESSSGLAVLLLLVVAVATGVNTTSNAVPGVSTGGAWATGTTWSASFFYFGVKNDTMVSTTVLFACLLRHCCCFACLTCYQVALWWTEAWPVCLGFAGMSLVSSLDMTSCSHLLGVNPIVWLSSSSHAAVCTSHKYLFFCHLAGLVSRCPYTWLSKSSLTPSGCDANHYAWTILFCNAVQILF